MPVKNSPVAEPKTPVDPAKPTADADHNTTPVVKDESVTSKELAEAAEVVEAEDVSDQVVRYVGQATERVIEAGTWPKGCDQDASVSWNFSNDFEVPASDFTPKQLAYLRSDGGFRIV